MTQSPDRRALKLIDDLLTAAGLSEVRFVPNGPRGSSPGHWDHIRASVNLASRKDLDTQDL